MSHRTANLLNQEFFMNQLSYIEENIQDLKEQYISSTSIQERKINLLNSYVSEIEQFLQSEEKDISKVLIGTKVTVHFEDDEDDTDEYVICLPKDSNPDEGCISFLSPVGRQLLLKEVGDEVQLSTPSGKIPIKITRIDFPNNYFQ